MIAAPSLEGVSVPVLSPCTPDGTADPSAMAANLDRLNAFPFAGYVLFGTTGEGPLLSRGDRLRYLEAARPCVPAGRALLATTVAESPGAALEEIELFAASGVDAVLVLTPRYYPARAGTLLAFYRDVVRQALLPVLAYNMPARTGVDLGEEGVRGLMEPGGTAGVKDSGGDAARFARLAPSRPPGFALLAGSGRDLAGQLTAGATGAILAVANLLPALACAVFAAAQRGDAAVAERLSALLERADLDLVRPGLSAIKAAAAEAGLAAGPPRLPLTAQPREVEHELRRRLAALLVEAEELLSETSAPAGTGPRAETGSPAGSA